MALSWGVKKQIKFFTIFALTFIVIVGAIIYLVIPDSTCFDKRQNQDEEATDCGGSTCIPCSNQIREINILWTRPFRISDGIYDFAALLENTNPFLMATKIDYFVKFYDAENTLIGIKENSGYASAGEKFIIFEPNINTQQRIPIRAILEIASISWDKGEKVPLKLDVLSTDKFLDASSSPPRVEARIKNQLNDRYKNIEASAVLWDSGDKALGVSRTLIDILEIDEIKSLVFTWPDDIAGVSRVEIFFRQLP